ncbi:MAG: hypothetical protein OHK0023_26050 [Anaerolineae bacterium]
MLEERRFHLTSTLNRVPEACTFVRESAKAAGVDARGTDNCELATEEWCTNIIEHGFKGGTISGNIEVVTQTTPGVFQIIVYDDGPKFDPRDLPVPDRSVPLQERRPGGLGWFFIQQLMDEVQYTFQDGHNVLTMIKRGEGVGVPRASSEPPSPYPARTLSNGVRVVTPSGRVDSVNGRLLEQALNSQLEAGFVRLVVEMQAVNYISSTGLKVLLTVLRRAQERGGGIALAALSRRVRDVFEMSGFDSIFTLATSTDEAVRSLE